MSASLDGPRAKLAWGKSHVDDLVSDIGRANSGHPPAMSLARQYQADDTAIVFKAESVPQCPQEWGLYVGDAIHNFRCALDHAWWQLALNQLRREPSEKEARSIQFPIVDDPADWKSQRFLKHVDPKAADEAKAFQLYKGRDELHMLNFLSNRDKHRLIQPAFYAPSGIAFRVPPASAYRDCLPIVGPDRDIAFIKAVRVSNIAPQIGEEAARIVITPTGPNPDLDFKPNFPGYIAIGRHWEVADALTRIGETVGEILARLTPYV